MASQRLQPVHVDACRICPPTSAASALPRSRGWRRRGSCRRSSSWNPTHCGDSEMRIARDGTWFHEGSPIGRPAMVRLFSTILRREPDGGFVLVTPVEKLDIEVEDAPFVAVELKSEGEGREPHARLPAQHRRPRHRRARPSAALRSSARTGPIPISRSGPGLEALVARPVYYELAEIALAEGGRAARACGAAAPSSRWSRAHEPRRRRCAKRSSAATGRARS